MQNIKAVLFDFDGVVNKSKYFSEIYSEKFGVPLKNIQKIFKDGRKELTNSGKADLKEILKDVLDEWQWNGTVDEFLELWFKTDLVLDDRMISTIKKIRKNGTLCFLASDQDKYRTEYLWSEKGIKNFFDGKFISCEIGFTKKEPKFFEFVIEKIGISGNEILYIDDSEEKLNVASSFGIKTYLYKNFEEFEEFITQSFKIKLF